MKIDEHIATYGPDLLNARRVWVGYSGGADSHVLLDALVRWRQSHPDLSLEAVHVHHGLNPEADRWAWHCEHVCEQYRVSFRSIRADIRLNKNQSVEEAARDVRYQLFGTLIEANDLLVVAHHQDDQAETGLLNLFRGSGFRGLASMPAKMPFAKGFLLRPFLSLSREVILNEAHRQKLDWIEDDSNHDTRFSRNFLRARVIPVIKERWPAWGRSMMRAASHAAECEELLQSLAAIDGECAIDLKTNALNLSVLRGLSLSRQKNLLRYWIGQNGFLMPSVKQLEQVTQQISRERNDAALCVRWKGTEVHRYRNKIFIMKPQSEMDQLTPIRWEDLAVPLILPSQLGTLAAEERAGEGFDRRHLQGVAIRFRQGGEVWRFHGHERPLKKCFQEWSVPVWLRNRIPLVYLGDTLAGVIGFGVDDRYVADKKKVGTVIQHQPFTGK